MLDFVLILEVFQKLALQIISQLSDTAKVMCATLATLDIIITMFFNEDAGAEDVFKTLYKKMFVYTFSYMLISNYSDIIDKVFKASIQLGNLATGHGASTSLPVTPGELYGKFLALISPIFAALLLSSGLDKFGIESIPIGIVMMSFGIGIGIILTCLEITITFVKFYLLTAIAILLMPFGAFSKTKDISMKGLHSIFSQAVEVVITVILVNTYSEFSEFSDNIENLVEKPIGLLNVFGVVILFYLLIKKVPQMVSTLLSGSIGDLGITGGASAVAGRSVSGGASRVVGGMNNSSSNEGSGGGLGAYGAAGSPGGNPGLDYK